MRRKADILCRSGMPLCLTDYCPRIPVHVAPERYSESNRRFAYDLWRHAGLVAHLRIIHDRVWSGL